jgi:hypothetical protein
MERGTKELGLRTGKTEEESKHGLMEQGMRDSTCSARNMEMETSNGQMDRLTQESF